MMQFTGLGAAAPWLWIALALALGLAERRLGAAILLWVALAALLTAMGLWIAPSLPLPAQLGLFAALAAALALVGRSFGHAGGAARARAASARALVGREAEVVAFHFHEGQVAVDGATWPARLDGASSRTPDVGERLRIIATDGRVMWVRPLRH